MTPNPPSEPTTPPGVLAVPPQLPLLALPDTVVYPLSVVPLTLTTERALQPVDEAIDQRVLGAGRIRARNDKVTQDHKGFVLVFIEEDRFPVGPR